MKVYLHGVVRDISAVNYQNISKFKVICLMSFWVANKNQGLDNRCKQHLSEYGILIKGVVNEISKRKTI